MTVSTTTFKTTVLGNGVTTVFDFDFIADSAATMEVFYTDSGNVTTLLDPSQYTLFINAPAVGQLWGVGGTVTYPIAGSPIANGTSLTIQRDVPYIQTVSIQNQGAFYPQAVEQALDLLELQIQQLTGNVSSGNGTATNNINLTFEFLSSIPTGSQTIGLTSVPGNITLTFPEQFSGSSGKVLTNPTSTFVAPVYHNTTHVGNMTISTSGVFTFDTCNCGNLTFVPGDYLQVTGPSSADSSIKDIAWTMKGVKT